MDASAPSPTQLERSEPVPPPADEDYNEISPQRQSLLDRIQQATQRTVLPALWAVLILADIEKLEEFVLGCESCPNIIGLYMYSCHLLTRYPPSKVYLFQQDTPDSSASSSEAEYYQIQQETFELAQKRDGGVCLFTHVPIIVNVHICSPTLTPEGQKPSPGWPYSAFDHHQFWLILKTFWGPEKVQRWNDALAVPLDPTKKVATLLSISHAIYDLWSSGHCAFRPVEYNHRDGKATLEVEWHWQPRPDSREARSYVAVDTRPSSSRDRAELVGDGLVRTGDRFFFSTDNPEAMPLPSKDLLELQWILTRIVRLSDWGRDSVEHRFAFGGELRRRVSEWLGGVDEESPAEDHESDSKTCD